MRISSSEIENSMKRPIRSLFVFTLATNLLLLAAPIHMLQVYDRVLTSKSVETLVFLTIIVLVALAAYAVAEVVRGMLAHRLSNKFITDVAENVFDTLVNDKKLTEDPNKILRDVNTVRSFLAGRQFINLFDLPFFPIFLFLMFMLHTTMGLVALVGVILMSLIAYVNFQFTKQARADSNEAKNQASAFSAAVMHRIQDIRAMGLLPSIMEIWGNKTAKSLINADDAATYSAFFFGLSKAIRQSLQIISMAWGAYLVLGGDMSGGMIFAASMLLGKTLLPVEQLIGGWSAATNALAAYRSVSEIANKAKETVEPTQLPEPQGWLTAENLSFQPGDMQDKKPILANISFTLAPGQLMAIAGPSGGGKSTLAKLLVGAIAPTAGIVRLDKFDLEQWPVAQRGQAIGYVPQDIVLFPGTIAENIARLETVRNDEKIISAAKMAGVHEMIAQLPDGYSTAIGAGTVNLSGGQRQRIALARAYYSNPKILVLDEPNAHLDATSEKILMSSLNSAKQAGVAIIIISHRSEILKIADFMMVIEQGEIKSLVANKSTAAPNVDTTLPSANAAQASPPTVGTQAAQKIHPPMPDALIAQLRSLPTQSDHVQAKSS